nr:immunoglobulin heavy chain junction region [Macaca mulatta]MOX00175.1 immunoglobulin heavy chain junction region [Macaca mulatta]MOX04128.1 immunoglobulin heavy chain junction region [Macaca mulatta]
CATTTAATYLAAEYLEFW